VVHEQQLDRRLLGGKNIRGHGAQRAHGRRRACPTGRIRLRHERQTARRIDTAGPL